MLTRSGVARGDTAQGAVELYYEDLGDPAGPPVLLIMGLGAQMIHWDDDFCRQLAARGFRTAVQGVNMHRRNEPGYCRLGVYIIDDWR